MKALIRAIELQAKDAWVHQKLKETKEILPLSLRREHGLASTLILDIWPLELWESTFLLF